MERPSLEHISENTRNHGGFECCNGCSIAEQVADFALHLEARIRELEGERDVLKADLATARRENAKHKEWYLDSEARLYGIREERDTLRTRRETLSGLLRELADHIVMNMGMCPGAKDYDDCQCDACCRARAAESGRGSE